MILPWKQKQCVVRWQHSSYQQAQVSCKVHPIATTINEQSCTNLRVVFMWLIEFESKNLSSHLKDIKTNSEHRILLQMFNDSYFIYHRSPATVYKDCFLQTQNANDISLSKAYFQKLLVKDNREVLSHLLHHCKSFLVNQMVGCFIQDRVKTYLQKASVPFICQHNWKLALNTILKVLSKEVPTTSASRSTSSIVDALFQ